MESAVLKTKGKLVSSNASLQIYGKGLDFEAIARELRTGPTRTYREGELARSGTKIQNDLWSIESPLPRTLPLDEHLQWLADLLRPYAPFVRSLARTPAIRRVRAFGAVTIDGESCDLRLSLKSLGFLTEIEVGMEFSLVFLNLSDSGEALSDQRESEFTSLSKEETYRTESRVTIMLPAGRPDLRAKLSSLGLPFAQAQPGLIDAAGFYVPLSDGEDLDSQLKWLARAFSSDDSLAPQLAGTVDIKCTFATDCEWGGTWLSDEALRLPVALLAPLGLDLRLL